MKKAYPVIDSESAMADYQKKLDGFQEILGRINIPQPQATTVANPLDATLMNAGHPTHFSARSAQAKKLGMTDYIGKPEQDEQLNIGMQLNLKNDQARREQEMNQKNSDRDFGLKTKELGLKEQQLAATKTPSADEIAGSIVKSFNK